MRSRSPLVVVTVVVLMATLARPAFAHEEIAPSTVPIGRAAFLTLTAANEASADLVRIAVRAPAGLALGEATRSPAGWSASRAGGTVTWTGGAVKPHTFESWGFEIGGAAQPGPLAFTVTLGYAGGRSDEHEVEITAAAPGAGAPVPATTGTTAATTTTTPAADATASGETDGNSGGGSSGTAKAALAISIFALLVAAGALAVAGRRRNGTPVAAPQDW